MYFVYLNGEKLFDPRLTEDLPAYDLVLTREVNSAGSLTFTITPDHPLYDKIEGLNSFIDVYKDDEWLWQGRVMSHTNLFNNCVEYYCEGALGYLNDSYQPQKEFKDITPMGYLQVLLDTHNEQVPKERQLKQGAITITDPNNSLYRYTNYNPTLQEMKEDLIDDLGGFLRVRKFNDELYLDALKEYGHTNEQVIRFGENLKDLVKDFDFMDLATCIVPLGAKDETVEGEGVLDAYVTIKDVNNGSEYLVINDLNKKYGNLFKVVQWNDVHVPSILLTKAKQYIQDEQFGDMVIDCKAYDMNYTDSEFERFELGDKVRVISTPHNLDRYFPITKQVLYLDNIQNNTLTLGGKGTPVSITGVTGKVTISTGKIDERIREPNKLLDQAVRQATELIRQGAINGHVVITEHEILIMDTDDTETAKNVWRWNAGGLGYSSNGYEGPFETAMTMDGTIVGKFIAANSVAADQIDINYTTSQQKLWKDELENNYWSKTYTQTQIKNTADNVLISAEEYTDSKLTGYYTKAQIDTKVDGVLISAESTINSRLGSYYTKAQIDTKVDSINLEVSKKVGTNEIISRINMSPESIKISSSKFSIDAQDIRLRSTTLSWDSTYSSMTSTGTLTCTNANIQGVVTCGNTNSQWCTLSSSGQVTGGIGSRQYGYIDFSAQSYNINTGQQYYGVQVQGGILRISTFDLAIARSSNSNSIASLAYTGSVRMTYNMNSTMTSCSSGTLQFINGICVACPS